MKIIGAQILEYTNNNTLGVQSEFNLSFVKLFKGLQIEELLNSFVCRISDENYKNNELNNKMQILEHSQTNSNLCIVRKDNMFVCIICEKEYPINIINNLISKIYAKEIDLNYVVFKCNDYSKIDKIYKVQQNVDQTREILHDTIEKVIERGVKIDDLLEKTQEFTRTTNGLLSPLSSRKRNSCCSIS